jgi:tetratricopeptide (TPR) repeat protein
MLKIFICFFVVSLISCRSAPKAEAPNIPIAASKEYEKGLKALEEERFQDAIDIFDGLLVKHPASELDLVVLFNTASAYEGLGRCKDANDRYRRVIRSSNGKFLQIEGQAYFRIALTYECMNQDTKTVAALLDTLKRSKHLPPEILNAEVPARLASAYARLGNRQKALEYFTQASQGIKKIVSTSRGVQSKVLGQTMYLMGKLSESQKTGEMDPIAYAQSIYIQQPYLLQSAETGHPVWAREAAADLKMAYDNIWKVPVTDENRAEFYTRIMQNIYDLNKLKLVNESDLVEEVYAQVAKVESRLQVELAKTSEVTKLTPEAQEREGLKRKGKTVSPPTVLEGKAQTKKKNVR